MADNDDLVRLITEVKESLERQIVEVIAHMDERFDRMEARFQDQSARLDRHGALWQTGRRWSGKMDDWAEKIDKAMETKDRQIAELLDRMGRLENERRGQQ